MWLIFDVLGVMIQYQQGSPVAVEQEEKLLVKLRLSFSCDPLLLQQFTADYSSGMLVSLSLLQQCCSYSGSKGCM
jgi:hypothetical protein